MATGDSRSSGTRSETAEAGRSAQRRPWALILFVLPVAAVVAPALYSRIDPRLGGVPFLVWYQFAAVVFGSVVTGAVYVLRGTEKKLMSQATPEAVENHRGVS